MEEDAVEDPHSQPVTHRITGKKIRSGPDRASGTGGNIRSPDGGFTPNSVPYAVPFAEKSLSDANGLFLSHNDPFHGARRDSFRSV